MISNPVTKNTDKMHMVTMKIPSKKFLTIMGVLHFLSFVSPGHSQTSPTWEYFDDDTNPPVKVTFSLDPNRLYINGINVKHFDTLAKLPAAIPKDAKNRLIAILFHPGDDRIDASFASDMFRMSQLLYSTGSDFSKLKIVSRSRSIKLGYAGEGPKGFKYFTSLMIYGCSKIPGQVTRDSVFSYDPKAPRDTGYLYEGYPLDQSAFGSFMDDCKEDLYAAGDPQWEKESALIKYSTQDTQEILNRIYHHERVVFSSAGVLELPKLP